MDRLVPSFVNDVIVHHTVLPTEVDGKAKAQWSGTATTACFVCGANEADRKMRENDVFTDKILEKLFCFIVFRQRPHFSCRSLNVTFNDEI